jgi:hypothetical protein
MVGLLFLLVVLAVVTALGLAVAKSAWDWRPPFGRRVVQASGAAFAGLFVYACGDLTGAWYSVSPAEAETELASILSVPVPPVIAVSDAQEAWGPGDYYHRYSARFEPSDFRQLAADWTEQRDSSEWVRVETPRAETWRRDEPEAPGGYLRVEVTLSADRNTVSLNHMQE